MKRKMLAARVDLADKISEIASRRGTLYDYINDILEQSIRAEELGLTLKEILDNIWLIKTAREAGFTIIPEKIIYGLVEQPHEKRVKERVVRLWYETGQWYGRYYQDILEFEKCIKKFFWDVSDFSILTDEHKTTVTCLSSKFSETHTEMFGKFLEGAFNYFGFELGKSEVSKGIINLTFTK